MRKLVLLFLLFWVAQSFADGGSVVSADGAEGISDVDLGGSGYQANLTQRYIIRVESDPSGATFSIDGKAYSGCAATPCNDVELTAGSHRFSFGMKTYFDMDTTIEVTRNGQELVVSLSSKLGILVLSPKLEPGVGDTSGFAYTIDGKKVKGTEFRLSPGEHTVTIAHACYETASFKVGVKSGSNLTFDQALVSKKGGIDLSVLEDGHKKSLPVYVNGVEVGATPYVATVPVCSRIAVGGAEVPVQLKANETVRYTHKRSTTFIDSRDGQKYKMVEIGSQTWMAENLNYEVNDGEQSWCYREKASNCKKYGRLYTWAAAVGKSESQCGPGKKCNLSGRVQGVCPNGWHLPSKEEWETLMRRIGGEGEETCEDGFCVMAYPNIGKKLKSTSGWNDDYEGESGNGTDAFGFSVLPVGVYYYGGPGFHGEGSSADFWSATEDKSGGAYKLLFNYYNDRVFRNLDSKYYGFSVRCLRSSL